MTDVKLLYIIATFGKDIVFIVCMRVDVYLVDIHPFNGPFSGTASRSRQITMPVLHHSKVFLQAGCPSCRPTNSVKALKAIK